MFLQHTYCSVPVVVCAAEEEDNQQRTNGGQEERRKEKPTKKREKSYFWGREDEQKKPKRVVILIFNNMSAVCCFGGVCIPYSAIIPLILIALQYIAKPLYNIGLLPDVIARRLGFVVSTTTEKNNGACTIDNNTNDAKTKGGCCGSMDTKEENHHTDNVVCNIESTEEFNTVVSKNNIVIVKMTAEWCKPCKQIHPFYAKEIAPRYSNRKRKIKFVVVDVDCLDDVATEHNVSILPCFVAIKNGKKSGQYSGSNETQLEKFVKESCM